MAEKVNVAQALKELTLEEKIQLLAGRDTWSTHPIERLNIPSITVSDGPHGVRGVSFFNGPRGCLLPSATAMGATFDPELMHSVGELLAAEAKEKECHAILAPTVCLQRSPLIGRGFEAFGEDPILSGTMASSYVNGVQKHGVAVSIKHYAAHDQSSMSIEDSIRVAERTMREMHMLPFQLAVKHANPWSFMMGYHRINGTHCSEDPWLIDTILRKEWGWDGLVMSDWFGTYSTAEAVNAGLDLEMPGPTKWRGPLLTWSVICRKVREKTIDERVCNLLRLINKVQPALDYKAGSAQEGDTQEKRELCREVSRSSIVLLKNEKGVLPLDPEVKRSYGLIGPGVSNPAVSGGGSADLNPYYVSKPIDAIKAVVGEENIKTAIGCYNHLFKPLLEEHVTIPGSSEPGYALDWYGEDPDENPSTKPVYSTTTVQAQMYFADNLPSHVPESYWLRVQTVYTAPKTCTLDLGLCVIGKGRLFVDGKELIDLYTSQPPKTLQTPMFDQASMEVTGSVDVQEGKQYAITVMLRNDRINAGVGARQAGGLRVGGCEKIDREAALADAVELAGQVDVPIVIAGLNADYESEAVDRKNLDLPPGVDELIEKVARANPKTVVVTQSGCPIVMPWLQNVSTLVHAWFGGQETGNAIADVLFGKTNPSGRLSVTFPKKVEDNPAFLTFGKRDRELYYGEGVFVGYRYYEKLRNDPLFYFGYGLSYTTFEYSNLRVPHRIDLAKEQTFEVSVDVSNTGDLDGHEVVQIYIQDVECAASRPRKELKGLRRVWVEKGKRASVKVSLDKYALSYWNEEEQRWKAEKGVFRAIVSRSADPKDEVLEAEFELVDNYLWTGL